MADHNKEIIEFGEKSQNDARTWVAACSDIDLVRLRIQEHRGGLWEYRPAVKKLIIDELEKRNFRFRQSRHIQEALEKCDGNVETAADLIARRIIE
jgi:hypothetical protein